MSHEAPEEGHLCDVQKPSAQDHGLLTPTGTFRRPQLRGKASTAVSLKDIYIQPAHDSASPSRPATIRGLSTVHRSIASRRGSDAASFLSSRSIYRDQADVASLLAYTTSTPDNSSRHDVHGSNDALSSLLGSDDPQFEDDFAHEFDALEELASDGSNEESLVLRWRRKLKHYFILSSAGKPIYSRHGDDQLISNSIGVIQTIISFFLDGKDSLQSLVAGDTRFVVVSKGHLHLVAISRLGESEPQLRAQLEALYTQILSALTLPRLEQMFISRPSTDLRRPLEGNAPLLSALADDFTRGSPSALLAALECLKMRKTHREVINQTMVKCMGPNLLYGLIVAAGRLVSVIRPKKHSLHPGDLQIIFNMLFRSGSIRGGGGENWIPLCLPGFNNTGYIYMYVSFLEAGPTLAEDTFVPNVFRKEDETVIVLISPNRDSFDDMRQIRDDLVHQLVKNGSLAIIRSSVSSGRPSCTELMPGNPIRHFLYKSRANVQFFMSDFDMAPQSPYPWRRLMTIYSSLHAAMHGKTSPLTIHHVVTPSYVSLAWATATFEIYCVAGPHVSREALVKAASKLEQWAKKEHERLFIIGGATF